MRWLIEYIDPIRHIIYSQFTISIKCGRKKELTKILTGDMSYDVK